MSSASESVTVAVEDPRATLRKMVREQLEKLPPWQRVEFIDSMVSGYCLECGERDDHDVCRFMIEARRDQ